MSKVEKLMEAQMAAFKNGVKLVALMQATLEQMDTMKGTKLYRHKMKSLMNSLEKEIERTVYGPLQSLDHTDEDMVNRIQTNIELILDMSIEEIGGLRAAVEEHREKKDEPQDVQ